MKDEKGKYINPLGIKPNGPIQLCECGSPPITVNSVPFVNKKGLLDTGYRIYCSKYKKGCLNKTITYNTYDLARYHWNCQHYDKGTPNVTKPKRNIPKS